MLNVLVMGAGAIGCFVGGHLAARGHQVTLIGREPLMQKVAGQGLQLNWPGREPRVVFPQTAATVNQPSTPYDFILLSVKSQATCTALEQLLPLTSGPSVLVSLQNGIGNEERAAVTFGTEKVVAGTITIPIQMPELGIIKASRAKGGLGLASLGLEDVTGHLAEALNQSGLPTVTYGDYRAMKWSKLLLNITTNALSAILNQPPSYIVSHPRLFDLEIEALCEAATVMQAQDIQAVKLPGYRVNLLPPLVTTGWLPKVLVRALLRPFMLDGRGAKMPSLKTDLASGRPTTEVQALNGAVVEAGQRCGVATPVNRVLTDLLTGLVSGRLDWSDYQKQPRKVLQAVAVVKNEALNTAKKYP